MSADKEGRPGRRPKRPKPAAQSAGSADAEPVTPRPFDVRTIRYLIRLMSQNDLSEIDLHEGEQRIRLRRGTQQTVVAAPMTYTPAPAGHPPAASAPVSAASPPPAAAKKFHEIKSETPGTFYSKPKPEADDYVKAGTRIVKGKTVVCLIEAMKLFNEITADCDGTVAEVCVENGTPVEYGTVLFKVDPA